MNYLLDTHALLWFINDDSQLSESARLTIENASSLMVSIASLWEISIKENLGKIVLPSSFELFFLHHLNINHINILDIQINHLYTLNQLPLHHRDPFDRLMIAQSIAENLVLISKDSAFDNYEINRLW